MKTGMQVIWAMAGLQPVLVVVVQQHADDGEQKLIETAQDALAPALAGKKEAHLDQLLLHVAPQALKFITSLEKTLNNPAAIYNITETELDDWREKVLTAKASYEVVKALTKKATTDQHVHALHDCIRGAFAVVDVYERMVQGLLSANGVLIKKLATVDILTARKNEDAVIHRLQALRASGLQYQTAKGRAAINPKTWILRNLVGDGKFTKEEIETLPLPVFKEFDERLYAALKYDRHKSGVGKSRNQRVATVQFLNVEEVSTSH
jgi:hypothetical protein